MHVYDHFPYVGREQRWSVPQGVTTVLFECWGAAGGMSSDLSHQGKVGQVVGGAGPRNNRFYNNPRSQGNLGGSFSNNAGYAAGIRTCTAGDVFWVYVGGNGGPGHSSIKIKQSGGVEIKTAGGTGGFNGGGVGGDGAHTTQNLFNAVNNNYHYKRSTMPDQAKVTQIWWDTGANLVKKCNTTYASGAGSAGKWDTVTNTHPDLVGPSGGGGGGSTDIRHGSNNLGGRILVAGGSGGSVGPWVKSGKASWTLHSVPANPAPPFGNDTIATGATGPDSTWATNVNFFQGGWGGGGLGGGPGPRPNAVPSSGGGVATAGDAGGPATNRHQDGTAPGALSGASGKGGGSLVGGARGTGGSGGQAGSAGNGGNGADAAGGTDDFCAGGGGGGGGWFGGGGGGQGFKVTGDNSDVRTRGGGGGGGSNYADPSFSAILLGGAAQPPFPKGNAGTGANGLGGFARISYDLPPSVAWTDVVATALASSTFGLSFTYKPAKQNGPGIAYYIVGTAVSAAATTPTSQTTIMVTDPTLTQFTYANFTAPAATVEAAYFVQVFDLDGDGSGWLKQRVFGVSSTNNTPATITAPAAGSTFTGTANPTWTVGSQTPLVAYKLGVKGNVLATGAPVSQLSAWQRGGSRVNLATDPGFQATAVWSSTANANLTSVAVFPGASGKNGQILWSLANDGSAEEHTTVWNNLIPGQAYRVHLGVASDHTNDPRPAEIQVWDSVGLITSAKVDLSATLAGTYVFSDLVFTPRAQGVFVVLVPSGSIPDNPFYVEDFEGAGAGSLGGFTANAGYAASISSAQSYQGGFSLQLAGLHAGGAKAGQRTMTPSMVGGAGWYVASCWALAPTGADHAATMRVGGAGVNGGIEQIGSTAVQNAWTQIEFPFLWDGAGVVTMFFDGWSAISGNMFYDFIQIAPFNLDSDPAYGSPDTGQTNYTSDFLVELVYDEDSTGYGAWFDGSHANGTGLTVSWSGTTNGSAAIGTGTDALTDVVTYTGGPLANGEIDLVTLSSGGDIIGYPGATQKVLVNITPSIPATPTVTLHMNTAAGTVDLTINAADGAKTNKTVYFDIFRTGVRVATHLTPDQTTRAVSYSDIPAHGEAATYVIRAIDSNGGYTDQSTGTIV